LKIQCDVHRSPFGPQWTDHSKLLKSLFARGEDDKGKKKLSSLCRLSVPVGGADRDRTGDPLLAKQVLSQLSYSPFSRLSIFRLAACEDSLAQSRTGVRSFALSPSRLARRKMSCARKPQRKDAEKNCPSRRRSRRKVVGLGRVELPTSPLSGVRSNQLSYRPNPIDPYFIVRL
jgi:hypothetical protein